MNWTEEQLAAYTSRTLDQIGAGHGLPPKPPTVKEYLIVPVPKPRMTQRDKWKQRECVMRYRAFADQCRLRGVTFPDDGAHITFVLPMPQSWPEKKRQQHEGQPHLQKPDLDNLQKALQDAVLSQDCTVWDVRVTKRWGREGKIIIDSRPSVLT